MFVLLFLRSIALCMRSKAHATVINLFLAMCGVLAGLTLYHLFIPKRAPLSVSSTPVRQS